MKPLFIVDIDSNLGQSKRNCPAGEELTVMSVGMDDKPNTFMTPSQLAFFNWISASGHVVPCTARHSDGVVGRMRIPFTHHAIVSFGGAILLPDHSAEPVWNDFVQGQAKESGPILTAILAEIEKEAQAEGITIKSVIKNEFGSDIFMEMKYRGEDSSALDYIDELMTSLAPQGWQRHRNDDTLALLPPWLGKEKAAEYYVKHIAEPALFVVGMGDSLTDLPFMQSACGYAMMPVNSQAFSTIMTEVKI